MDISFDTAPTQNVARVNPERLIGKDPILPDELRKLVVKMAKHLGPYEAYASTIDWKSSRDRIDLFTLLHLEGTFGKELLSLVQRIGKKSHRYLLATASRMIQIEGRSPDVYHRFGTRFDEIACKNFNVRLLEDGRRLAWTCMIEAELHCRQLGTQHVSGHEAGNFLQMVTDACATGKAKEADRHDATWRYAISRMNRHPDPKPVMEDGEFTHACRVLAETDLRPTTKPVICEAPSVFSVFGPCRMEIDVAADVPETAIVMLTVRSKDGVFGNNWRMSRFDGHILSMFSKFIPYTTPFENVGMMPVYERLRRECVQAVLRAIERGELVEHSTVGGERFEQRLDRALQTPDPVVAPMEIKPVTRTTDPKPALEIPTRPKLPAYIDFPESMGHGKKQGSGYVERCYGALEWRRIMGAFHRCGVEIDITTRHPKLHLNGRTAGFLNRHHNESVEFNRTVAEAACETLGIDLDDFYREL